MQFKLKELKNLLNDVQKYKAQRVKIKNNNFELLINGLQIKAKNINKNKQAINAPYATFNATLNKKDKPIKNKLETKSLTIISPMVGRFYRASSPNEEPFVKVLDIVEPKQTVCIIEAMKLMNEIEAEIDGKIIEILVKDGEFVECGQPLIIVEPT